MKMITKISEENLSVWMDLLIDCFTAHQHRKAISAKKCC